MASLSALTHLMHVNVQLEELRVQLNEPIVPLTNDAILSISTQLQPMYKKLIITNLDEALSRRLEMGLWNDCFKTPLTRFGRTDKHLYHLMIEAGVGYYLGLIQDIGIHFDISFITTTTDSSKLYCTKTSQSPLISPSKASVFYIIQSSLLHVGDLLRYRGSYPEALKMYEKSGSVCPSNGYPYHQMGITSIHIGGLGEHGTINSYLSSFYYFSRALGVTSPYAPSQNALESLKSRLMSTFPTGNKYHDFIRQFLLMVSSTIGSTESHSLVVNCNVVPMLGPLITNQQITPVALTQVIAVSFWAHWRSVNCGQPGEEEYVLDIICGILNSILIAAVGLFGAADDIEDIPMNKLGDHADIDKRSTYIPHLKLILDWLVRLQHTDKQSLALNYMKEKAHKGTLVKLLNQIKLYYQETDEDSNNNYILPEEKKFMGFIPLDYSTARGTLLDESNPKTQKTRISRLLQSAVKLANGQTFESIPFFVYDGAAFHDTKLSPITVGYHMPSRRNVALTSIFRSNCQSLQTSPTFMPTPTSLSFGGNSSNNTSVSSDIFRSIWTPNSETNRPPGNDLESTWN